jgi:type II secretory ATPase GspE/PulE/Tfp pilus assembly ATPase PilB-like protein
LSKKTRALDKQFTNQLKKEDWESIIKEFQKNMTDSLIESAIKKQPPEIFAIRGEELVSKIRSRRDGLLKHVMKYYYFLRD